MTAMPPGVLPTSVVALLPLKTNVPPPGVPVRSSVGKPPMVTVPMTCPPL